MTNLDNIRSVHLVGIGGIGVSALARMFLGNGSKVSGTDARRSEIAGSLEALGATVSYGRSGANVPSDAELVVYSPAVPVDDPDIVKARELGIPALSYPEALGALSKSRSTIAVSGTHGKSTTASMTARALIDGGLDPTVVVGALMKLADGTSTNFIHGHGEHLVAEACEYKRSFLSLWPTVLVITNIEEDHLDYYRDLADIQSAFRELALRVPEDGTIVCDAVDRNVAPVIEGAKARIVDYRKQPEFVLRVPGRHNARNAQAALAAALAAGVDRRAALDSLSRFGGIWRRFEFRGETAGGARVYDDYAHHPSEIRATLEGAREAFPGSRIVAAFQPHLYSRTRQFLPEFVRSLSLADEVLVAPIYAARERFDPSVSHAMIAEGVGRKSAALASNAEVAERLAGCEKGDIIVIMGAGDLDSIVPQLISRH